VFVGAAAPGATGGSVEGAPKRGDRVLVGTAVGIVGVSATSTSGGAAGSSVGTGGAAAGAFGAAVAIACIGVGTIFSAAVGVEVI
jgi:hypothetical protein